MAPKTYVLLLLKYSELNCHETVSHTILWAKQQKENSLWLMRKNKIYKTCVDGTSSFII